MKEGIKKRKSSEMKDVVISDTMISIKISRGNEHLFDELATAVLETGSKSRNRLIENILIDYVEERKQMKIRAMKDAFIKKSKDENISSDAHVVDFEQIKIAE